MEHRAPRLEQHLDLGPEIGRGGFGVVRRGVLRASGEAVAVKLPLHAMDAETRARVTREAELLEGLEHPNLVGFRGVFEDREGRPALVYQLVEGTALDQVLDRHRPSPEQITRWLSEAAEGLAALHSAGLVHRDVKPGNLMLRADGSVVVLDFGLAREVAGGGTVTAAGILLGTPAFMAPEQLSGHRATPATDVYALGCLAYRLVAGRLPFEGEPGELVRAHLGASPPPIDGAPPSLMVALRAALEKDPELRPGVRAFAARVGAVLREAGAPPPAGGDTTRVVRAELPRPRESSTRRRARRARILAPLLGIALGAAAFGWALSGESRVPAPSTTPAATGTSLEGLPERIRDELSDATGWIVDSRGRVYKGDAEPADEPGRAFLDPDPYRAARALEQFDSLRQFRGWLESGGRPEELAEELRGAFRECDRRFLAQELPAPFGPMLTLEPAPGGWSDAAARELSRAGRLQEQMNAEVRRGVPETFQATPRIRRLHQTVALSGTRTIDFVRMLARLPDGRVSSRAWIEPLVGHARAALYATFRSIEAEPGEAPRTVQATIRRLNGLREVFFSFLATLPPALVFGRSPRSPLEWALQGRFLDQQASALLASGHDDEAREVARPALAALRRGEALEGEGAGVEGLRGMSYALQAKLHVNHQLRRGLAELIGRYRAEERPVGRRERFDFARDVLRYWHGLPTSHRLPRETLEWAAAEYDRNEDPAFENAEGPPMRRALAKELARVPLRPGIGGEIRARLADTQGKVMDSRGRADYPERFPPGTALVDALTADPQRWNHVLRNQPEAHGFRDWVAAGGRPEALPEPVRRELLDADAAFREQGLPAPFHPYLYVLPEEEAVEVRLPEEIAIGLLFEPPLRTRGWLGAAFLQFAELRKEAARLRAEARDWIAGKPVAGLRGLTRRVATDHLLTGRLPDFLRWNENTRLNRVPVQDWSRGFRRAWQGFVYASERYLHDVGSRDLASACLLRTMLANRWMGATGPVLAAEEPGYLGLPAVTDAQWIFRYELLVAVRRAREKRFLSLGEYPAREAEALERLARIRPIDADRKKVRAWVLRKLIWTPLDERDHEATARAWRAHREEIRGSHEGEQARTYLYLLYRRRVLGKALGVEEAEVPAMMGVVRAHRAYLELVSPEQLEVLLE